MNNLDLDISQQLIEKVANGDRNAFSSLYTNMYPKLYRYIMTVTKSEVLTEDILQDIFTKLWIKRLSLVGVKSIPDYIFRMAKNHWFDIQKLNKHTESASDVNTQNFSSDTDIAKELIYKEYYSIAQKAIASMPDRRREIFLLNAQEELTAREIAEKLGLSLPVVKKQLYKANHYIKSFINQNGGEQIIIAVFLFSIIN
ncbi:MAG TPA: sigma-70 family RNA polymerase sigma factor [Niabella sp.]|jgi:RNA polymerase sigma-70 factor (family 1)|nr:sigma-70 family RNA polymerase sigma factor [Niabella sp.]HRO85841.1 sigma-70 family RNA polymerase sigma factor [Niabella sp.]HUN01778.1 sigma-70 family RNA polymerase sigma factor [Niabella sp.]